MSVSRRRFLRGSAGLFLALPILESMRPRTVRASDPNAPQRALWWFTPNGQNMEDWTPADFGSDYNMSPILSPFESYRDTMTILKGLRNYGCDEGAEGHSGAGTFLTCAAATVTPVRNARSIDQIIADQIGGETLFKSLQLGMNATGESLGTAISWADAETPLPKVTRPEALFTRLFGGGAVLTPEELEHRRSMELSILDGVFDDLQALRPKLPARDRLKLEQYTTSIREVELRIEQMGDLTCDPGEMPTYDEDSFPELLDAFCEVIALAIQCDLSRIFTFTHSGEGTNMKHSWLDIADTYHGLSHHNYDAEMLAKLTTIQTWQSQVFADGLLRRLRAIEDIDGRSLLDNTILMYGSGLADSHFHDNFDLPIVLFGGTDAFTHGQHIDVTDEPLAALHLAISEAVGASVTDFGVVETGPLTGLS